MASYDSRSRHHDSFSYGSQLDPYYQTRSSRDHHDASRRSRSSYGGDHNLRPRERNHSPRRQRSSQHLRSASHRPEHGRKHRWPPAPSVEDETSSIAKEYRPILLGRGDDPPMRGKIDQEPTIIDLEPPLVQINGPGQHSRASGKASTNSVPSASLRRPSVDTQLGGLPDFSKRKPSPYSYSKPEKHSPTQPSGESLLSPELTTPGGNSRFPTGQRAMSEVRRTTRNSPPRSPSAKFVKPVFDDSDSEEDDAEHLRDRKPSRYSFAPTDLNRTNLRTSLRNAKGSSEPRHADTTSKSNTYHKGAEAIPRQGGSDGRRSPQIQSGTTSRGSSRQGSKDSIRWDSTSKSAGSRPTSPSASDDTRPITPPRSKAGSGLGSRSDSPLSSSIPSIKATAAVAAAATAGLTSFNQTDPANNLRTQTFPPDNASSQGKHKSQWDNRRTDSAHESILYGPRIDVKSPSPRPPRTPTLPYPDDSPQQRKSGPLPYPDDHHVTALVMPAEEKFQTDHSSPVSLKSPQALTNDFNRSPSLKNGSDINTSQQAPVADRTRSGSAAIHGRCKSGEWPNTRERTKSVKSPSTKLPPCSRCDYSTKHDDWSTLVGISSEFNICPYCYEDVFSETEFASSFQRSSRKPAGTRTRCDFSSPWIRLAWLLTVKRRRKDLDLLYDVASVTTNEPDCPGPNEAQRSWYNLTDEYGDVVANFRVCPADVRRIEALLPSMRGAFLRARGSKSSAAQLCSLRSEGRRFSSYLDMLVDIDEATTSRSRRGTVSSPTATNGKRSNYFVSSEPDLRAFTALIRSHSYKLECLRDNIVLDSTWHFMPGLTEFTVCEECYEDVIMPDIVSGSSVAGRFNRAMQFVSSDPTTIATVAASGSSDAMHILEGNSCQLYSPRMRRVWYDAVMDDDMKYLERKARERKRVEVELQVQMKDLTNAVDGGTIKDAWKDDKVTEKVRRIMDTWKDYE